MLNTITSYTTNLTELRKKIVSSLLLLTFTTAGVLAQGADQIRESQELFNKAKIALQDNKVELFRIELEKALKLRPGQPIYLLNYAYSLALNEQYKDALDTLDEIAEMGLYYKISEIKGFESLKGEEGYQRVVKKINENNRPVGKLVSEFEVRDKDLLVEGVAVNENSSTHYLTSVHKNMVIKYEPKTNKLDTVKLKLSPLGIKIGPNHKFIWVSMAGVEQGSKTKKEYIGLSGIARIELEKFSLHEEIIIERDSTQHVFGDLIIDRDGSLFISDSKNALIYKFDSQLGNFNKISNKGDFISPQGLIFGKDNSYLIVSDYSIGLLKVNKKKGEVTHLKNLTKISLLGIDGIYRYKDDIIAVQNGLKPNRVLKLKLDEMESKIIGYEILYANGEVLDDPTLGIIKGDKFYLNANSQWQKFSSNNDQKRNYPKIITLNLN